MISEITAREILDSRGRPTIEVDVTLRDGARGRSSVPAGASMGSHEARELRDDDPSRYDGYGVRRAVRNVVDSIAPAVVGRDPFDQAGLDAALVALDGTSDKSRFGANAILGVSMATARAAARSRSVPLWRYLCRDDTPILPIPMVNIISGGLHSTGGLAFQDFLIIPVGSSTYSSALESVFAVRAATLGLLEERGLSTLKADEGGFGPAMSRPEEALDLLMTATARTGRRPGEDVTFALDVAATHFFRHGHYSLPETSEDLSTLEMIKKLENLVAAYPITSIEDALAEDDWEGWYELTRVLGERIQLVGDDLFTTNIERVERGIRSGVANAVLVKMNQIGTLTQTREVIEYSQAAGYATVVSARSGETEDPFLADFAVATSAGQIKIGSLAQSERLSKYNQLLRIEEELGSRALFAGSNAVSIR